MEKAKLSVLLELAQGQLDTDAAHLTQVRTNLQCLRERQRDIESRVGKLPGPGADPTTLFAIARWGASADSLLPKIRLELERLEEELAKARNAVHASFKKKRGLEALFAQEVAKDKLNSSKQLELGIEDHVRNRLHCEK